MQPKDSQIPKDDSTGGASNNGGGANDIPKEESIEELKERLQKLEKHNSELFSERKKASERAALLEKERQEAEEKALKEKGNFETLYKSEQNKNLQLAEKFKAKVWDNQIKDALRQAGCSDEKKLSMLMGFEKVRGYTQKVKFSDDHEADKETLNSFVTEIKSEFQEVGFFSKVAPSTKDVNLNNDGSNKAPEQLYKEELMACKTIQEIEAVRKKYKRN